jgi:formylglycine-generating enzyme required for sulfatase activity
MHASRLATVVLLAAWVAACTQQGEQRGQTVLVLDTDLPVDPAVFSDAAVDTLRIDVFAPGADRELRETREFAVGDRSFWPFSIGVVGPARLRVRLFAARWAAPEVESAGLQRLSPRSEITIDRLLDLAGASELVSLRAMLNGDCRGVAADLRSGRSCLGADHVSAEAAEGITIDHGEPTRLETWAGLAERSCRSPEAAERPCILGGFSILGDIKLAGVPTIAEQALPLRPVVISPFRMDKLEFTVGRYRALIQSGYKLREVPPTVAVSGGGPNAYCTYIGLGTADADALPLNCVSHALAEEVCTAVGGRLPTEAEWEHAASGRGEGRAFSWGNNDPSCCRASLERSPQLDISAECARRTPEPAGSHDGRNCSGGGDVSRDKILDMAGSLLEYTSDGFAPVGACLPPGVLHDPQCPPQGAIWVLKGANWTSGYGAARRAIRAKVSQSDSTGGFRCAYSEPLQ